MPKHLLAACLLYIASRSAIAALAPLYEAGIWRLISPVLMLLFISIVVLFMRRFAWTWRFVQWIAVTEIVLNAVFFPTPEFYGIFTSLARLLIATIMFACSIILWSLVRRPETKAWFSRP
jgi:hypothetical protein